MAFSVGITQRAYDEIDAICDYIAADSPQAARNCRDRLLKKISSLEHSPFRHGLAPEALAIGVDVRQTLFGVYRILYVVDSARVTIHGVRHGARENLRPEDLPGKA